MTQTKTCGNCRAWEHHGDDYGICYRAPPSVYLRGKEKECDFPTTEASWWCLSFIPKDSGEGGE